MGKVKALQKDVQIDFSAAGADVRPFNVPPLVAVWVQQKDFMKLKVEELAQQEAWGAQFGFISLKICQIRCFEICF